jgi:hypothetical protein
MDDFIRRAETIYEQRLAGLLKPEHQNEFVAIEPESGSYFFASSEESMGEFWVWQVSEVMIKGGFVGVLGSKAVGFSGDQF